MAQKIENIFLYTCTICWLSIGLFLSFAYFIRISDLTVVQPTYQLICYGLTMLMLPQFPLNFYGKFFGFGVGLFLLESAL